MQTATAVFLSPWIHGLALLLLCSAYLQGAFDKIRDFGGAVDEMRHFGLSPAVPMAVVTIAFELLASALVISGWYRWLGALALAAFTVAATFLADRYWLRPKGERVMVCLLYTSPSPRDVEESRMPSSA